MKNQYFGDENDYRKYGLLRILAGQSITTAICWMLTENDEGADGRKVTYLNNPKKWRPFDPELFDKLNDSVHHKKIRNVESADQLGIIPRAVYYPNVLSDNASDRRAYFKDCNHVTKGRDLIFFDPDNGLEVGSTPYGSTGSSKYLFWDELLATYKAGHSVLAYQHFPRVQRNDFRDKLFLGICERLAVEDVIMFTTPHVLFVLIPQSRHLGKFINSGFEVGRIWEGEIRAEVLRISKGKILEALPGQVLSKGEANQVTRSIARMIYRETVRVRSEKEVDG